MTLTLFLKNCLKAGFLCNHWRYLCKTRSNNPRELPAQNMHVSKLGQGHDLDLIFKKTVKNVDFYLTAEDMYTKQKAIYSVGPRHKKCLKIGSRSWPWPCLQKMAIYSHYLFHTAASIARLSALKISSRSWPWPSDWCYILWVPCLHCYSEPTTYFIP